MTASDDAHRFEEIDWSTIRRSRRRVTGERVAFAIGLALCVALYQYDRWTGPYLFGTWQAERIDYVVLVALVTLGSVVGVPLVRHSDRTRSVLDRFRSKPTNVLASLVVATVVLSPIVVPLVFGPPELRFGHSFHAPVGFASKMGWSAECLGPITRGDGVTRYCGGSWQNPLGTNRRGIGLHTLLGEGAIVASYVVLFTAAFVVPLAAVVGIVAGFRGGWVDDLLMGYVDVQLCIPALVAYFIGYMYWNVSILLLLVTFGLLSWGGVARLIRSETLQRREAGYVLVARSLGGSASYIGRRHVIPNITNTLVPAVFHLLALLVLVEAGVAFLGFHHVETYSWGSTIQEGIDPPWFKLGAGFGIDPHAIWWISTFPTIALAITLVSVKLVGDGLRDALDPKRYR